MDYNDDDYNNINTLVDSVIAHDPIADAQPVPEQ